MARITILGIRSSLLYRRGTTPEGGWDLTRVAVWGMTRDERLWAHCPTPRGMDLLLFKYQRNPLPAGTASAPRWFGELVSDEPLPPPLEWRPALDAVPPWEWEV